MKNVGSLLFCAGILTSCALTPNMTADVESRACEALRDSAIVWVIPVEGSGSRALDTWCARVGPIIYQPTSALTVSSRDTPSILLAAWNVDTGGGDIQEFLERELGARCGDAPIYTTHVVLLVQEATQRQRDQQRTDVSAVADRCGMALLYVPSSPSDGGRGVSGVDLGNAVLSTLPLEGPFAIELPQVASRQVAAGATVRFADERRLRVVSLHFNTFPSPWRLLGTGNSSRVRQSMALGEALGIVDDRTGGGGVATVAGGDLNTWSTAEGAFRRMQLLFPESPEWHGEPTRGPFPTDHLFFRVGDRAVWSALDNYRRIDRAYGSDHYPVAAQIRLSRP